MMLCFLPMMLVVRILYIMAHVLWIGVSVYYKVRTLKYKCKPNLWFSVLFGKANHSCFPYFSFFLDSFDIEIRKNIFGQSPKYLKSPITSNIIEKYGVLISQWAWLYQALLEVSMNKITLWINVCADDWTTKGPVIASNEYLKQLLVQTIWVVFVMYQYWSQISPFMATTMTMTCTNLYYSQQYNTCYQGNQSSHPVATLEVNQLPVTELLTNGVR